MRLVPCYNNDNYIISENSDLLKVKGNQVTGRNLKASLHKDGYTYSTMYKNGKKDGYYTHVLMLLSFYGYYDPEMYEVNHKDENKSNNILSNLELLTHTENVRYSTPKRDLPCGIYHYKLGNIEYYRVVLTHKGKQYKAKLFNKKYSNALEQALLYLEKIELELGIRKPN